MTNEEKRIFGTATGRADKVLTEVSDDFAKLILTDVKDDKDLVYSKACLDRELAQYVGKRFVPYDERYKF